jgi:excinuclease ABC subunit A
VVEHDEDTIRAADHVVDIGPGRRRARRRRSSAQGTPAEVAGRPAVAHRRSTWPARWRIEVPRTPRRPRRRRELLPCAARAATTCSDVDVDVPARAAGLRHRRVGLGQVARWSTTRCTRRVARELYGASAEPAPHDARSTGWSTSTR